MVCGFAGGLFARWLIASLRGVSLDLPTHWRARYPVRFALGCGFLIALIGVLSGGDVWQRQRGHAATLSLLENEANGPVSLAFFKFVATWLTAWAGMPAGIFAPSLSIGQNITMLNGYLHGAALIALGMMGSPRPPRKCRSQPSSSSWKWLKTTPWCSA